MGGSSSELFSMTLHCHAGVPRVKLFPDIMTGRRVVALGRRKVIVAH